MSAGGAGDARHGVPRVAICAAGELFGGVERHILGAAAGLRAQGVEAMLVVMHERELAAQARARGFDLVVLPSQNRLIWSSSRQLADALRERDIRIVHVHGYKAMAVCMLARARHGFAVVRTEHGLAEPMPGRPFQQFRDRLYRHADAFATRLSGATVCYVTEELRAHFANRHRGLQTAVIANAVERMDSDSFRRPAELRAEYFNLAIVGRLESVKGHAMAIAALSGPGMAPDVHLHIVGTGPDEMVLRELSRRHGIAERVHFLGFRRDALEFIAHCDILLMPSLHEGLPYTLLEGMALARPIVASRVGGLAEVIEHETGGLLVPSGDAGALAGAIRRLADEPTLRARLGTAAQRLQRERYSLDVMTGKYLAVYQLATGMHRD